MFQCHCCSPELPSAVKFLIIQVSFLAYKNRTENKIKLIFRIEMAQKPTRDLLAIIARNFINSLKPRKTKGNLVGSDYFGNKYYEIPAEPSIGKRKASRWFEPVEKEDFEQEMPAEWEAWLRGRRSEPPQEEEVMRNLAIMQMKKKNAAELDAKYVKTDQTEVKKEVKGPLSFPKYDEYEIMPGKPRQK